MESTCKCSKNKPLKIVQVVPNYMTIPPEGYGAIERITYDLIEELVKKGHEVYVFAREGSKTSGKLIQYPNNYIYQVEFILNNLPADIDIIHDHTRESFIGQINLNIPTVCTIHDYLLNPVKHPVFVSSRAKDVLGQGKGHYVYNGIHVNDYEYLDRKDNYLYFTGVLSERKGVKLAIEVAEKTGDRLVITGPVQDWDYYVNEIQWVFYSNPKIESWGVAHGEIRQQLYKYAKCVLFPSVWEEPFGLVMIESMACGTPVLALRNGAVPEVMKGFPDLICDSVDEMVEKVKANKFPTSMELRKYVEDNFSVEKMVQGYEELYYKILNEQE